MGNDGGWKSRHCAITYADGRCGELRSPRGVYFLSEITPQETMAHETEHEHDSGRGLALETAKPEVARPPLFQVLLLNDDFTPMDFVVEVLRGFFNLDQEQAVQVMLHVHTRGKGVCGVFTREVAETKVTHVNEYSRSHQHPLLCTMEKL
jgi:ATP-dependent Clp protease adaptor protein ClpS